MRLAVSNIGWTSDSDARILPLLKEVGVDGIEVAPGRLFDNPVSVTMEDARLAAKNFTDAGLPIVSMQALLFGQPDMRMFGNKTEQSEFKAYLARIIKFAGALGCGPLVFGSPKNRLKGALGFNDAAIGAAHLLQDIGNVSKASGTVFCLEANSTGYGCDFMTCLEQAAYVAAQANHPGVAIVADTGNMIMEDEPADAVIGVKKHLAHIHISAPNLAPVKPHIGYIKQVIGHLSDIKYEGVVTLEMRVPDDDDPVALLLENAVLIRNLIG